MPHRKTNAPPSALEHGPGNLAAYQEQRSVLEPEHRRRILSISAVPTDHDSLRSILSDKLWQVDEASNYQQAVACLCRDRMDIVVCESHLPDGTWRDLLGHIAEMMDAPALIVTSRMADADFRAEVHALGGYDVLIKPFNAEEVKRVLAAADRHRVTMAEVPVLA